MQRYHLAYSCISHGLLCVRIVRVSVSPLSLAARMPMSLHIGCYTHQEILTHTPLHVLAACHGVQVNILVLK